MSQITLCYAKELDIPLRKYFPSLTDEEIARVETVLDSMEKRVFKLVLDTDDKKAAIDKAIGLYLFYVYQTFSVAPSKFSAWRCSAEQVSKLVDLAHQIVEKKIDSYLSSKIAYMLDVAEEHDRYITQLIPDKLSEFLAFLEKSGIESYVYTLVRFSVGLGATLHASLKKHRAATELAHVTKIFAEELESYVATFQVLLEPELKDLRTKSPNNIVDEAEEVQGSILEYKYK